MAQFSFLYLYSPEPFVLNPCLKSSVSYHGISLKLFFQITNYLLLTKLSDFSSEVIPLDLLAFSSCAMRASKNMVSISHISLCNGDYFYSSFEYLQLSSMNVTFLVGMATYLSQNTLFKMYMYVPHSCCFKNFVCFHFIKKISFRGHGF